MSGGLFKNKTSKMLSNKMQLGELQPKHRTLSLNVRRLQDALSAYLNDEETSGFIDALNSYHSDRDVFEFVSNLKKILNSPTKRQLFPLVKRVIPRKDIDSFELLTKGGKSYGTVPRVNLYKTNTLDTGNYHHSEDQFHTLRTDTTFTRKQRRRRPELNVVNYRPNGTLRSHHHQRSKSSSRDSRSHTLTNGYSIPPSTIGDTPGEVFKLYLRPSMNPTENFGFSIRGGTEYGLGVYVSSVDPGGVGEYQGLQPGDLIVEANDISFKKISHVEAAKIIKAARKLELTICRVGKIPGTHVVHQTYRWIDPKGRPVSPPPEVEQLNPDEPPEHRSRSGLSLLKGSDERKVNVKVPRGKSLGLMVRGGREFGLGIYISGVDHYSVAENAGLKVGDQLLDVNGYSFLDISHSRAVKILKVSRRMVITVKDVGKLPFAKTTIDKTQWIDKEHVHGSRSSRSVNGRLSSSLSHLDMIPPSSNRIGFSRGAGSQLMLNSMARNQWDMIEEQGRILLNEKEQATFRYYLSEYQRSSIMVDGLVFALFELLNTQAKMTLLGEIRPILHPKDLHQFDHLVLQKESEVHELGRRSSLVPDSFSLMSYDSTDLHFEDQNKRTLFSSQMNKNGNQVFLMNPVLNSNNNLGFTKRDLQSLRDAIEQIQDSGNFISGHIDKQENDLEERSQSYGDLSFPVTHSKRGRNKSRSRLPKELTEPIPSTSNGVTSSGFVVRADIHQTNGKKGDDLPSDDSGVESNGHLSQRFQRLQISDKVTISPSNPVDINLELAEHSINNDSDHYHHNHRDNGIVTPKNSRKSNNQRIEEERLEEAREKYGDISLDYIRVYRCKPTLGMAIEGGANTRQPIPRVINVQPGGSAFECGELKVGHVILEVNGQSLLGMNHTGAAKTIAEAFKNKQREGMELLVTETGADVKGAPESCEVFSIDL